MTFNIKNLCVHIAFYTLPTGRRSCYNDLGYVTLRALPSNIQCQIDTSNISDNDIFNKEKFIESFTDLFALDSEYDQAYNRRLEAYDPAKLVYSLLRICICIYACVYAVIWP